MLCTGFKIFIFTAQTFGNHLMIPIVKVAKHEKQIESFQSLIENSFSPAI